MSPATGVLVRVRCSRRAAEFALFRPAREVLFTVVPREEKYAAKNFVDTFVYRCGDVVGAGADRVLATLGAGAGALAAIFLPLGAVWIGLAAWLGRRQRALAAREEAR